ncbi:hypothetical protein BGW38_003158 [Lunasporangiospora selenospora]|uniref:CCAAT-binding factor domain-containing protein n=1 Tax=Lunasporangiospora selenospora TaxID=979761 RepID=A0A9P6G2W2_9FUNG|nr:hypothetical protein BGW38_003158 [Lunasporangiospora selenospora]
MAVPKQARASSNSAVKNGKEIVEQIRSMESQIAESKTNLNNLAPLLQFCQHDNPKVIHAAIHALFRVFSPMVSEGELRVSKKATEGDSKAAVAMWLRENYKKFTKRLCELLDSTEPGLQIPALKILLDLVKLESADLSRQEYNFANALYLKTVESLLYSTNMSEPLMQEFSQKFVGFYDDLRFYFLKNAAFVINVALGQHPTKNQKAIGKVSQEKLAVLLDNSFGILESLNSMPTDAKELDEFWAGSPDTGASKKSNSGEMSQFSDSEDEDMEEAGAASNKSTGKGPLLSLHSHRRAFSDCWIAVLKLPFTQTMYKKTLLIIHKRIIPHLPRPVVLMDFLTDSYNSGGAISLLALKGLFVLITEHNLDYPDFFQKLYLLFDHNLMHAKYRARFFSQVDIFLSSPLLPATLVAAFIKRMARLSLSSPPASIVITVPFIYNLLKRHPTCMQLIHGSANQTNDCYDHSERDPMKCNAFNSSLWELQTLQNHFAPNVATLAKIFNEQFTKPSYNLEDFLDHTYSSMFRNELTKKRRGEAAVALEAPTGW